MKKFKALAAILVSILFITGNIFAQNACGIQATPTTPVGCFGSATGSIDLQLANPGVSGGYTYQWSNGATTQDLTNIPAGTYTVLITYLWNGQGCQSQSNPITVNQPQFGLSLNTSAFPVSCFGLSDGWTELVILGGTAPYETHWSNGANTEDLDNVPAGTYFVTVTDANGCVNTGAVTVGQPAPLQVSTSVQQGSCGQFGSIDVSVSGGTAGYTYDWSNDGPESPDNDPQDLSGLTTGTYTVTITDAHGCPVTTSATITGGGQGINPNVTSTCDGAIISGLTAGTYTVTITNADGCTSVKTFTVACNLAVGASVSNVSCNGGNNGAINLNVTGGTIPYTFHWNTGSSNQNLANLPAGTYTVTVTDATNNTKTVSATVSQPSAIFTSASVNDVSNNGGSNGSINLSVSGGTPGYTFHWNNNALTEDVFNLAAGIYTVTVTDVNWCTVTLSATVNQPPPCVAPNASFAASSPTGFIAYCANLSTGTNLSYHWWFGDGQESTEENPTHTYQNTGMYLITLKATNECGQDSETKNILISGGGPTPVVEPGNDENGLTVFPNPAVDFVSAKFENFEKADNVYLFNSVGQQLASFGSIRTNEQINVEGFEAGTYYLCFKFGDKITTRKLVKSSSF